MLNLLVILLVGGLVGWVASLIMRTDGQQGALMNIVIGVVGSFLGAWFFGTVLGVGSAYLSGEFSIIGIFWAVVGSVILIGLLKLLKVLR